jgi:hypothetical protein
MANGFCDLLASVCSPASKQALGKDQGTSMSFVALLTTSSLSSTAFFSVLGSWSHQFLKSVIYRVGDGPDEVPGLVFANLHDEVRKRPCAF